MSDESLLEYQLLLQGSMDTVMRQHMKRSTWEQVIHQEDFDAEYDEGPDEASLCEMEFQAVPCQQRFHPAVTTSLRLMGLPTGPRLWDSNLSPVGANAQAIGSFPIARSPRPARNEQVSLIALPKFLVS